MHGKIRIVLTECQIKYLDFPALRGVTFVTKHRGHRLDLKLTGGQSEGCDGLG